MVASVDEMRHEYSVLVGTSREDIGMDIWEENIKTDFRQIGCEEAGWIKLT
jgi:hypothetical protein